jgi:hypothetical protein
METIKVLDHNATGIIGDFRIKGLKNPKQSEEMRKRIESLLNGQNQAIELLKAVLMESGMENDCDRDIYEFLKEQNQLPEGYTPYWEDEDEDEGQDRESYTDDQDRENYTS